MNLYAGVDSAQEIQQLICDNTSRALRGHDPLVEPDVLLDAKDGVDDDLQLVQLYVTPLFCEALSHAGLPCHAAGQ